MNPVSRRSAGPLGVIAAALLLAGCTHAGSTSPHGSALSGSEVSGSAQSGSALSGSPTPTSAPTELGGDGGEETITTTTTVTPPRSTVTTTPTARLSTGAAAGQVDGTCPYIPTQAFSDGEGDRIGRVTVSTKKPVDCTFYFDPAHGDPNAIVGEINVQTFSDATRAYNAMASSYGSKAKHPEVQQPEPPTIGDGALLFQTDLQGSQTWQCVFAKGTSVFTVRTRQPYPALNAANLARTIAARLH